MRLTRLQRRAATTGPVVVAITAPTYPGNVLRHGVSYVITGLRFGAAQGTVYFANATHYAAASQKVQSTVTVWGTASITATFGDPTAVGMNGYIIVVRADGRSSPGLAAVGIAQLVNLDYSATFPDGQTTAVEGGVSYDGGVLNAYDTNMATPMGANSVAKGVMNAWPADKTCVYMETDINLSTITVCGANGFGGSALIKSSPLAGRVMLRVKSLSGANITVFARVTNAAGGTVNGDDVVVAKAGAKTLRLFWQRIGNTVTVKAWIGTTALTFAGQASWSETDVLWAAQGIDVVEMGLRYNNDGTLAGTNNLPAAGQALILTEDNTKVWGMAA